MLWLMTIGFGCVPKPQPTAQLAENVETKADKPHAPKQEKSIVAGDLVMLDSSAEFRNQPTTDSLTFDFNYYTLEKLLFEYSGEENGYAKIKLTNQAAGGYLKGRRFFNGLALYFYASPKDFTPVVSSPYWHTDQEGFRSLLMPGTPLIKKDGTYFVDDSDGKYLGQIPSEHVALSYKETNIEEVYKPKVKTICHDPMYTPEQWNNMSTSGLGSDLGGWPSCGDQIPVYSIRKDKDIEIGLAEKVDAWLYKEMPLSGQYFMSDYELHHTLGALGYAGTVCGQNRSLHIPKGVDFHWQDGTFAAKSAFTISFPMGNIRAMENNRLCFAMTPPENIDYLPVFLCADIYDLVEIQQMQNIFPMVGVALADESLSQAERKRLEEAFARYQIAPQTEEAFWRMSENPKYLHPSNWISWVCANIDALSVKQLENMIAEAEKMANEGGASQVEKERIDDYKRELNLFISQKRMEDAFR